VICILAADTILLAKILDSDDRSHDAKKIPRRPLNGPAGFSKQDKAPINSSGLLLDNIGQRSEVLASRITRNSVVLEGRDGPTIKVQGIPIAGHVRVA